MRSDRDTLDSAGEMGQLPVLFCCSLLVVRGSFLRPYGRIVGAVPKGGPPRINGDIHNRSMRHGFTNHEQRATAFFSDSDAAFRRDKLKLTTSLRVTLSS